MPKTTLGDMVQYFRNVCEVQRSRDLTDADLLRRFLADGEGAAFAVLVQRHGPMVLGLCKRILGDLHSAEDALQATFMVLVRRAASIRCTGSLGNWLYAAAKRIALKAKAKAIARQRRERQLETMPRAEPIDELTWQELRSVLDEEIGKLPKKYRAAIILCHLESKSHEQAAKELGWPKTTLTSRLVRGRELLRQGLVRRGVTLSAAAVVTALAQKATAAPVTAMLTLGTVKAATRVLAGEALGGVGLSVGAVALAEDAMKGIFWMKAKVMLLVLLLGFGAAGAGLAGYRGFVEKSQPAKTGAEVPVPANQAAPLQEQGNEAEKLFRAMEKKIMAAKSLKVVFETDLKDERGNTKLKGSSFFATGNKARLELDGTMGGKPSNFLMVSDGEDLIERQTNLGPVGLRLTPKRFNVDLVAIVARCGGFFADITSTFIASKEPDYDIAVAKSFAVSAFTLGPKEQLGKRQARVINYTIDWSMDGQDVATITAKVWVDAETMLPLKRILKIKEKDRQKEDPLVETYSEFLLDPQLDAKLFELPKEEAKPAEPKANAGGKGKLDVPLADLHGDPRPETALARLGTVRFRPGSNPGVIFVPGTNVLASNGGSLYQIRTWDAGTGQPLKRFMSMGVGAFSADGKLLLTGSHGLVDFTTGKQLRQLSSREQSRATALSPDGLFAAAGENFQAKNITLWDTASGNVLRRLEGHAAVIKCLAFSPDGKMLVSGSEDKTVRFWDVATGKELRRLGETKREVRYAVFAPGGKLLATAEEGGIVQLWDVEARKLLHQLKTDEAGFQTNFGAPVAFGPDGKVLAAAGLSGRISLCDPHTEMEMRSWLAHSDEVRSVSFSTDGKTLASVGTNDSAIRLWDTATGNQLNSQIGHTGAVKLLQFAPDGKTIMSGGQDLQVLEWGAATGKARQLLFSGFNGTVPTAALNLLAFSADGKFVALGERLKDKSIVRLWDAVGRKELRVLSEHPELAKSTVSTAVAKFSPNSKLLATNGRDGGLRILEVATGKELQFLQNIRAFAFAQDSLSVFVMGTDNAVRRLELATGKELCRLECPNEASAAFVVSADDKYLASTNFQDILVLAADTGKVILSFRFEDAKTPLPLTSRTLAFSPSGRVLAVGGMGTSKLSTANGENTGTIQLWDVYSGQRIRQIDGPQGMVWSLVFAPDGRILASGGDDTTILLWDLAAQTRDGKQKPTSLTVAELDGLWTDLGSDAAKADKAIWALARAGNQGASLLSERLRPVAPADGQQVAKLVADLAGDQFPARQMAAQALTDLGEQVEAVLRKVLATNPPLEVRQRLEKILEKRDQDPEIIRRLRAIEALEHLGTSRTQEMLQTLAKEAPHPRVAQAAAAAFLRPGKR